MASQVGQHDAGSVMQPSPEQLKELLILTGLEIMDERGLGLGADSISYVKVFAYLDDEYSVKVTRGSVHERIWPSHDDFRREVLAEALRYLIPGRVDPSSVATAAEAGGDEADPRQDPEVVEVRVARLARLHGASILAETVPSDSFGQVQALKAVASRFNDPLAVEVLRGEVARQAAVGLTLRGEIFSKLARRFGLRPRRGLGLSDDEISDLFHTIYNAAIVGLHLYQNGGYDRVGDPVAYRPVIGEEADEAWSLLGVALRAQIDFFYEPDPDVVDRGDLPLPGPVNGGTGPTVAVGDERDGSVRRPRKELKRLVLAAAVELLLRDGFDLKSEALGYTAVFARLKQSTGLTVHRSTVHNRFWSSHEEFQLDVLRRAVQDEPTSDPSVVQMFEAVPAAKNPDGSIDRRQTARDKIRLVTERQVEVLSYSLAFKRRLLVKAALIDHSDDDPTDRLRAVVRATDHDRIERQTRMLGEKLVGSAFKARPDLGISDDQALDLLGLLAILVLTGTIFDQQAGDENVGRRYGLARPSPTGGTDHWLPGSLAALIYFEHLFVPK